MNGREHKTISCQCVVKILAEVSKEEEKTRIAATKSVRRQRAVCYCGKILPLNKILENVVLHTIAVSLGKRILTSEFHCGSILHS